MYTVAFANQKGGVGKTTSCVNMAAVCAAAGHRVLLVDCDPQGNSTSGLGVAKKSVKHSVYDGIIGEGRTRVRAADFCGESLRHSVPNRACRCGI